METSNTDNWKETTFLANVAKDLMVRFGKDMTNVTVVFPNKRARLFMNEEFLALTDTPMWAPEYATIAELFGRITGDNVMEPIPAVCTLYNIYKVLMGDKAETLDMFWGWGEIIISDFDDIDKHLVNADALFLNAKELGDIAWYLAEAATGLNIDLSEVLQRNLDKLHARYPQGFDTQRSQHREQEA